MTVIKKTTVRIYHLSMMEAKKIAFCYRIGCSYLCFFLHEQWIRLAPKTSVAGPDPDPDPPDKRVFGPPGSGFFYH